MKSITKLPREFYMRDTLEVASALLGKVLVHRTAEGITRARITEVEAYCGIQDKASHAYGGKRTGRTEILYGEGGYAYVYLIYGMHCCMNMVTRTEKFPECVFLRALEPLEGIELMKKRRKIDDIKRLCDGPGKLCKAMGIDKSCYGADLTSDVLYVEDDNKFISETIIASKRINIDYAEEAKEYLWRFSLPNN